MRAHQIESWALDIIDRVQANQPIEDSRVEIKAKWISPEKAARRLAGHANASRGAPILWLIGLDEQKGVVGADHEELADWYAGVKSQFDGLAPKLTDLNIPVEGKTVVALYFETERTPFVVKNPSFGKPSGGPVAREVPWREGTRTCSATRADLLRLLSPLQMLPDFEVLSGTLKAERRGADESNLNWGLKLELYAVPSGVSRVVIPFHRCRGKFAISTDGRWIEFEGIKLSPPHTPFVPTAPRGVSRRSLSKTIESTRDEVLIYDPGKLLLYAWASTPLLAESVADEARVSLSLVPTNADHSVPVDVTMSWRPPQEDERVVYKWAFESDH